jgi:hypothetical protein
MSNCNHDVIAWRDEHGEARLWGCYHCKVKFVPMTQLFDEVLEEREACAKIAEYKLDNKGLTAPNSPKEWWNHACQNIRDAIRARGQDA